MATYTVGWSMFGTVEVDASSEEEALAWAPEEIGAFIDFDGRDLEIVGVYEEDEDE